MASAGEGKPRLQKRVALIIAAKKMPQALRLGANPPFQRVEETTGACKKARLFTILREFCCGATRARVEMQKTLKNDLFNQFRRLETFGLTGVFKVFERITVWV
ncbi:hypothetical protein [Limnohabitans sp. Rim8]|jgi:hypothetical protein|uniref:hypothetical protein n=1 Tax=Limnohabitans sp. Rim8 TaxID=1100718 RepID=UPI0025FF5F10|nr:hypothetical protein [Limnohabitans sp. Rim8]